MLTRIKTLVTSFPPQFWLMAVGLFISSVGASMIWPFLMIYVSEKLNLTLSTVSTLITINALVGLMASFLAGAIIDRYGRKVVMALSLFITGICYLFISQAETFLSFALIMVLMGLSNPLYQVGSDAMLADLIPPDARTRAFAAIRMVNNAGIAVGPALGGFIASHSYSLAFLGAAASMVFYALLLTFRARETLDNNSAGKHESFRQSLDGYKNVFTDRIFVIFSLLIGLGLIAPSMMWTLLSIYAKQNFGLPENLFGWLPTTNALMCVFIQYPVTLFYKRFRTTSVIWIGVLIYAVGVGSVALMDGFWGFWTSMVLMTFGELTLLPTVSKFIADIAPSHMRGRYMSFYWFAWGLARGSAPIIGGLLNDHVDPRAIWIGGLILGLCAAFGLFLLFSRQGSRKLPVEQV